MTSRSIMTAKADKTKAALLEAATEAFLRHGFMGASLRAIAREAGLTTGAVYRYFQDKDALFTAATQQAADSILTAFDRMIGETFVDLDQGIAYTDHSSAANLRTLFDLIYEHFDGMYLLVVCAKGSSREGFVHALVERETESTLAYMAQWKRRLRSRYAIDEGGVHMLCEALVNAMLEVVRHRMDRDEAWRRVSFLGVFFSDGWAGIERQIAALSDSPISE